MIENGHPGVAVDEATVRKGENPYTKYHQQQGEQPVPVATPVCCLSSPTSIYHDITLIWYFRPRLNRYDTYEVNVTCSMTTRCALDAAPLGKTPCNKSGFSIPAYIQTGKTESLAVL
jgi:hypothetical protein